MNLSTKVSTIWWSSVVVLPAPPQRLLPHDNQLSVALIQDRPVLGGNGSSEVRVWPEGHINLKPYPRVGDIVGELIPPKPFSSANAIDAKFYDDAPKIANRP